MVEKYYGFLPQPPPPGDSILTRSAARPSTLHFPGKGLAVPSARMSIVRPRAPGLPPDKRVQGIERGQRLDESVPGTGLGLAIVRDISKLYGGTLTLAEASVGGLKVCLELPGSA